MGRSGKIDWIAALRRVACSLNFQFVFALGVSEGMQDVGTSTGVQRSGHMHVEGLASKSCFFFCDRLQYLYCGAAATRTTT